MGRCHQAACTVPLRSPLKKGGAVLRAPKQVIRLRFFAWATFPDSVRVARHGTRLSILN